MAFRPFSDAGPNLVFEGDADGLCFQPGVVSSALLPFATSPKPRAQFLGRDPYLPVDGAEQLRAHNAELLAWASAQLRALAEPKSSPP